MCKESLLTLMKEDETQAKEPENPHQNNDIFAVTRGFLSQYSGDFYIYAGDINPGIEREIEELIKKSELKTDRAVLWLTTRGGSPDSAYMIARSFQRKYPQFSIFINSFCKSSGTLLCLGADELIMGENGHLGPLDIQILNREEFGERHSGLNPIEALNALGQQATGFLREQFLDVRFGGGLSTKQALEVSTNLAGHLFSPITAQMDFMKYGEFTRSMRIGIEYGERLAKHRKPSNLRANAVRNLAMNYPSHGFVIDREEARETLFTKVTDAPSVIMEVASELQLIVDKGLQGIDAKPFVVNLRDALEAVPQPKTDSQAPEAQCDADAPAEEDPKSGGTHEKEDDT